MGVRVNGHSSASGAPERRNRRREALVPWARRTTATVGIAHGKREEERRGGAGGRSRGSFRSSTGREASERRGCIALSIYGSWRKPRSGCYRWHTTQTGSSKLNQVESQAKALTLLAEAELTLSGTRGRNASHVAAAVTLDAIGSSAAKRATKNEKKHYENDWTSQRAKST